MRARVAIFLGLLSAAPVYGDDMPPKPAGVPAPAPAAPASPRPAPNPPTPEQVADAVRAAVAAQDVPALGALAAKDAPDPWLVAAALLALGAPEAALAFAKAAPRGDVERLPTYLASHGGRAEDAAPRARLAELNAALARKDLEGALGVPSSDGPIDTITGIRLRFGRGLALRGLQRKVEAAKPLGEAAEAAERVGWLARATFALHLVGYDAYERGDHDASMRAWTRRATLEDRRGVPAGGALAASSLGSLHAAIGDLALAVEWKERAVGLYDRAGDVVAGAIERTELADAHVRAGRPTHAREVLQRAVAALEPAGPTPQRLKARIALQRLEWDAGRSAEAIATARLVLTDAVALDDLPAAGHAHGNLGCALVAMGRHDEGADEHRLSLAIHEAHGDRANASRARANLAQVDALRGRYAEAIAGLYAARRVAEEGDAAHESEARMARAQIHGMLAQVHFEVGSLEASLSQDQAVLALLDPVGDRHQRAHVVCHVGQIQWARGEMSRAFESFEAASAIYRSVGNASGIAAALTNLGILQQNVGDLPAAIALYEQALAIDVRIGDGRGQAALRNNMGTAYADVGRDDDALAAYAQALVLRSSLEDPAAVAWTRANIASLRVRSGDVAVGLVEAEQSHREFTAIHHRAGAAFAMLVRVDAQIAAGNPTAALSILDEVVAQAEEMGLREPLVRALSTRAALRLAQGDPGGARDDARRALRSVEVLVSRLADEQGSSARSGHARIYETGAAAAARLESPSEVLFFLESGRAGALLETLKGRASLRSATLPDTLLVAEAEARAQETAAVGAWWGIDTEDPGLDPAVVKTSRRKMLAAQEGVREVVGRIQREAKRAAHILYPKPDELAVIRGRLAQDEALVLYGLFDAEPLALVVTAKDARIAKLPPTTQVVAACEALIAEIRSRTSPKAADLAADALRDLVVKPLGLAPETKRLLISPDGALSYVPFTLLAPDRTVVCVPSGTTYGTLLEEGKTPGEGVLALGDPDYEGKAEHRAADGLARRTAGHLDRLPASAEEARATHGVLLLGKDATERGLRTALAKKPRWHAIHLACHGLIDDSRPAVFSSLALTPEGQDDGLLTMLDVFRSQFSSDLVVLSACDTGKGEIVKGEGIMGLTRAFMYAGAPRVICSLWKVNDVATAALMKRFYELWNPKSGQPRLPAAEALRKAQESVRDDESHPTWKHPHYWAAWVLWGLPS